MVCERGPSRGGPVYCEVEGVAIELAAENLRPEGLFVPTPEPLAIDHEVELFLRSPAGEIVLRGLVVQVIGCADASAQRRSPGYGVLFLDLQDAQRAWITRTKLALEATRPSATPAERGATAGKSRPRIGEAFERARTGRKVGTSTLRTSTRAQLEAELTNLKARSPSEILGLRSPQEMQEPREPQDVDAAHRAFLAASKRFHPHVYARFDSAEITRLATEVFIFYKRAYATVRSAAKEGPQPREVGTEPLREVGTDPPRVVSLPPPSTRRAVSSLRPPQSASLRAPAARVSMSPSPDPGARRIADAELLLSSAVRHLAATRFEQADGDLAKAAGLAPERIDIAIWRHVCRARGHKARGRHDEALASYRKVLELDPQHREARQLLERGERRRGGLVGKWLGKDDE